MFDLILGTLGFTYGVTNIDDPNTCGMNKNSPKNLYTWLIVYGITVLILVFLGLGILKYLKLPSSMTYAVNYYSLNLLLLFQLVWIIYGCVLIFDETNYEQLVNCNEKTKQSAVLMRIICILNIVAISLSIFSYFMN